VSAVKPHGVALALAMLGAAACHHTVRPPRSELGEAIRFEGNHSISSGDLRTGLALHRAQEHGAAPDPYLVAVDGERIRGAYLRRGYLEVDVRSRVERRGDAASVIYRIDEGPRATTRVVITGLPEDPGLDAKQVRAKLPLRDGEPFDYEPYDKAKTALLAAVEDAGYAHATLDAHVVADRAKHEAVVELAFDPGPKCRFGNIDVTGATGRLRDAVRARLAISPGQQFSTAAIARTQRAIYDMKRFSAVRVLPDKTDGDSVDVKISLARSSREELKLGGGFGIDPVTYEVRARVGYTYTDLLPLTSLELDARPAYAMLRNGTGYEPRVRALARLTRIDMFHPFVTGELEPGYNYLAYEAWTSYGPHLRAGVSSPLGIHQLHVRVGWMIESLGYRNVSPLIDPATAVMLGLESRQRTGEFQQSVSLDLRDQPVEPRLGVFAQLQVNEGTPYAGSALDFTQIAPELRGYLPIGDDVVVAARARAGAIYGDIPVSERYFAGGANSQRGFAERQLAPTAFGFVDGELRSVPIGGGGMFDASAEVRARLGTIRGMGVGGVVFLDGGDVEDRFSQIAFSNLHWASGAGVRVFTIVGAVRLDFGYRLNRTGPMEPEPSSHYAFHLSLGEAY
jgi:outer membrane protein assembly factor BamA